MSDWLRPLAYVGLEVIPPGLMIVTDHPWLGLATFVGVLTASLVHSRVRTGSDAARERELLSYARHVTDIGEDPTSVVRALRPGQSAASFRITPDGEERPLRDRDDQLIHFPPRRLPL
jgi:hypothetical protein